MAILFLSHQTAKVLLMELVIGLIRESLHWCNFVDLRYAVSTCLSIHNIVGFTYQENSEYSFVY